MRSVRCRDVFGALIAEFGCVNSGEEIFPGTEKHWRNGKVDFVDQPRAKVLLDCRDSAAKPDVLIFCGVPGSFKSSVNSVRHEMEGSSAIHGDRRARVVGEDEDGRVVRRVVAPPSLPVFVGPGTSNRPEHISTNDPCANIVEAARREFIVSASCPAILAMYPSKSTCCKHPFMHRETANAKRICEVLVGASTITIDGNCEAVDAKPWHESSFTSP